MIDRDALDKTKAEDPALVSDLIEMFCEHLPELLTRFDRAVQSADANEICESAHMMKSRLRYLHCSQLADLAAEIEKLSHNGMIDAVDSKYVVLKAGISDAVSALRETLGAVKR